MEVDRPEQDSAKTGTGTVSLSKIALTTATRTVSLAKQNSSTGLLRVNLNWNSRPPGGPGQPVTAIDLDLGCLYEFVDGRKGVVQALGNLFTASLPGADEPVIWLDKDDRSGSATDGENLYIRLTNLAQIRRIMVFAYIYEGVANWAGADGVVTLFPTSGPQIEVRLDAVDDGPRICGVAMLQPHAGELVVRREVNYLQGSQSALDKAYGWGITWKTGKK